MNEVHDRRVRAPEDDCYVDYAARQPDHLALLLAAGLDRRAGVEALPSALRQEGVAKFSGRVAEPAIAGSAHPNPLHRFMSEALQRRNDATGSAQTSQNWPSGKAIAC